jgi:excisionase family DNA binding protein
LKSWRAEKDRILEARRQKLLLTTREVAEELRVTKTSVLAWLKKGRIQFIPLINLGGKNEKKKYSIPVEEVKQLKRKIKRKREENELRKSE